MAIERMALEEDQRISEVVKREQSRLRNFIRRRVPDPLDAEDILQDVFYRLVEANRLLMPIEHVTGWLFRVARNRITDLFRKKEPENFSEIGSADEEDESLQFEDLLPSPDAGPEALSFLDAGAGHRRGRYATQDDARDTRSPAARRQEPRPLLTQCLDWADWTRHSTGTCTGGKSPVERVSRLPGSHALKLSRFGLLAKEISRVSGLLPHRYTRCRQAIENPGKGGGRFVAPG